MEHIAAKGLAIVVEGGGGHVTCHGILLLADIAMVFFLTTKKRCSCGAVFRPPKKRCSCGAVFRPLEKKKMLQLRSDFLTMKKML